ncbi:hypothetical protein G5V59_04030 [Nocardioides sp. W3-2-3]|nr:hypothetical protein [Nocardioides convexus]
MTLERTGVPVPEEATRLNLALLGADRPGIVAEVSAALAGHGVSIAESGHRRPRGADGRRPGSSRRARSSMRPRQRVSTGCGRCWRGSPTSLMVEIESLGRGGADLGVSLRRPGAEARSPVAGTPGWRG